MAEELNEKERDNICYARRRLSSIDIGPEFSIGSEVLKVSVGFFFSVHKYRAVVGSAIDSRVICKHER